MYIVLGIFLIILSGYALYALQRQSSPSQEQISGIELHCEDAKGSSITMHNTKTLDKEGTLVPREFITNGGDLHIVIKDIRRSGVLDTGATASLAIGPTENDWQLASNAVININTIEDKYDRFSLEAGQYWLWVSDGGNVEIISCEPDNLSLVEYDE